MRKDVKLALLTDLLEEFRDELEPLAQGTGAHGPVQSVIDAANRLIGPLDGSGFTSFVGGTNERQR